MLRVEALVETERRKEEILRALGPILHHPSVIVEVSTVAEALERRPARPRRGGDAEAAVREVEVTAGRFPADAELRRYFSARLVGAERIDEEVSRFVNRVMGHSRQALLHAAALKRLAGKFTPDETRSLAPGASAKWAGMVREHAQAYRHEVERLRRELRLVFAVDEPGADDTPDEATAARAAALLLQLSYIQDDAVRAAFTVSGEARTTVPVKSRQFWRALGTAERLTHQIERSYQK
jgi:hypothetical protein